MATLINKITEQVVHVELVHDFLAAVENAEHWIEQKAEELLGDIPTLTDAVATEGEAPTPAAEVEGIIAAAQEAQPEAPAIELPAEAAAIAADPAAPGAAEALNDAAGA